MKKNYVDSSKFFECFDDKDPSEYIIKNKDTLTCDEALEYAENQLDKTAEKILKEFKEVK